MIRIVASVLVVAIAAPAVASAACIPEGAEVVTASECCCPADAPDLSDPDAPAQLDRRCCCDVDKPPAALLEASPVILAPADLEIPAAALVSRSVGLPERLVSLVSGRSANARAPPSARSLFAQQVSLLL